MYCECEPHIHNNLYGHSYMMKRGLIPLRLVPGTRRFLRKFLRTKTLSVPDKYWILTSHFIIETRLHYISAKKRHGPLQGLWFYTVRLL
jgi:hypothetical protein